jgi:hypothetical protein
VGIDKYSRARKEAVDQPKSIITRIVSGLKVEDNAGKLRPVNTLGTAVCGIMKLPSGMR